MHNSVREKIHRDMDIALDALIDHCIKADVKLDHGEIYISVYQNYHGTDTSKYSKHGIKVEFSPEFMNLIMATNENN